MASGESGPPRFISTTAMRAMSSVDWFSEQAGERSNVFRRCVRQHSMSEIEDVRATAELLPKLSHRRLDSRTSRDQQDGIEIPLHCSERLQAVAGITCRHCGIDRNPVDACLSEVALVEKTSAAREADYRIIVKSIFQRRNDAFRRFDHPLRKGRLGQDPRPAVEQLHAFRAS